MNSTTKILVTALLILALTISVVCIGEADAEDTTAGGGGATLQEGSNKETDFVDVTITIRNNNGWSNDEKVRVSVVIGNTTNTGITSTRTISNVPSGSVITIEIADGIGFWGRKVHYFGINENGKEYSLGLASGSEGNETYWNKFSLEITNDTEFILDCSGSRLHNPITITNNSDVDLYPYGKIYVNGASEPVTIGPDKSMKIWGNLPYKNDSWFRVEFDSDGKIPVVDFVNSSYAPESGIKHSIGDGFFETLSDNPMAEITFDLIDESELVDFPDRTLVEGESYDITVNNRLDETIDDELSSQNEASLKWTSSDEEVATIGKDGKLHCYTQGTCTISVVLTYDSNFEPESNFPIDDAITFNVVVHKKKYTININDSENGDVTADSSTATEGHVVTLTVQPNDGYILDSISTSPNLKLTPTENGYTFVMPDEDVVVTPTFVPVTHTVTFHNEGVSWEVPFSHGAPLEFPEDPLKESDPQWDYRFSGWVDSDDNTVYEGTLVADDMHLYAKYVKTERLYDIDFLVNGIVFKHYDLAYNDVIVTPADPYVEGYDFVGWSGYTPGMTVVNDMEFHAVFVESSESIPPWQGDDDPPYIPPNIVVEKSGNDYLWIFVVLGSVATFLFLLFAYFERRDREE